MAAPAGVGSGSAPESAAPEPVTSEPVSAEPAATGPVTLEPVELVTLEPVETEPVALSAAVPEPSRPGPGENVAAEVPTGGRRGVSRLTVAGVILVLVAVVAAAGVLAVATHGFRHKTVVTYRPAAVFSLRAGDCINSSPNGLSVTILSCATPHEAEVFATFSLTGSSWPGERGRATAGQQRLRGPDRELPEPAAADRGPDPAVRLPQPRRLAGQRPHRGVRGQLVQRDAQRLGQKQRLTAIGPKNARAIGPFRRTTCPLG